jgi:RimJ/RimL family protein N-acetyltransferase
MSYNRLCTMLFTNDYTHEFDWRQTALRVGFIRPEARHKISQGIAFMSRETIRHRFFGIKNGFTERELKHLTEIDGLHHFALGVEEVNAPERGIAVMRLVRDDEVPNEAEVALLIIDEYQKAGLGTLLMKLCLLAASERGIDTLRFTYLPDNTAIVRLVKRFGEAIPQQLASDYVQMKIKLEKSHVEKVFSELKEFFASATNAPHGP